MNWKPQRTEGPNIGTSNYWEFQNPGVSNKLVARSSGDSTKEDYYRQVKKVLNLLGQKYTIEMLTLLVERETMRHREFLEIVPNTTLSYRLRGLREAGLVTSRPSTPPRVVKEYYLTLLGRQTVQWLNRTRRTLASPAMTKKMEEFRDIKMEYKDADR